MNKTRTNRRLEAAAAEPEILAGLHFDAVPIEWTIAAADGGKQSLPTFKGVGYTGGLMILAGWSYPCVVDLAGLSVPKQNLPVRLQHDSLLGVGHTTGITVADNELRCSGIISRVTPSAQDVTQSGKNGFPWQMSIGASVQRREFIDAGAQVIVNGQTFSGPVTVVKAATLGELSFVDIGADTQTTVSVAATSSIQETIMDKKQAKPGEPVAAAETPEPQVQAASAVAEPEKQVLAASATSVADKLAIEAGAELRRQSAIMAISGITVDIQARAITEKWSPEKAELEVLRASRPKAHNTILREGGIDGGIIEAALAQTCRLPEVEKHYPTATLEAAHRAFRGSIGIGEAILAAAQINSGYTGRARDLEPMLRAAFPGHIQGAFSTVDIGGILSNIANKFLLAGFTSVEQSWRKIAGVRNARDFKTMTSYRLTSTGSYQKVGAGGEIKHGTLGNESFTNKVDTYALMLALTRQDLINDDLGALSAVPQRLGRSGALTVNEVFWTIFLANTGFFTAGNKNLATSSALSISKLGAAVALFRQMVDQNNKLVGATPKYLVVPSALEALANQIYKSTEMRDTTASKEIGTTNVQAGKYEPVVSAYLDNASMTGNSATSWYLLADPLDLAAIEIAFLNGRDIPTIETSSADFNALGVQFRGYHDFGAGLQDPKAGVRCNS
jgi:hypothetical protein